MKNDDIKIQLRIAGVKIKAKVKDGVKYFRLRDMGEANLEYVLEQKLKVEHLKTDKGFYIPKDEKLLKAILKELAASNKAENKKTSKISEDEIVKQYTQRIKRKKYSERTKKNYINHFRSFIREKRKDKSAADYNHTDIAAYLKQRAARKQYSISDTNLHINAIKFYFSDLCKRAEVMQTVQRPKNQRKNALVLDEETVKNLISQTKNLKHKAIILLAYRAGLKSSEIINLKTTDFPKIKSNTNLSRQQQQIIAAYLEQATPKKYFFEGLKPSAPVTVRLIQKILRKAKQSAGVIKIKRKSSRQH